MTGIKRTLSRGMIPLLLAAMLLSSWSGFTTTPLRGAPMEDDFISNAAVIKTQKAADKILNQGGIRGIDVSKYQGTINWAKVAKSDVEFAFIRASYGTTNDPYFISNAEQAHENGIKVGAYHYATFKNKSEMKAEAAHFISRLKKVTITYPVVLDLESNVHKQMTKSTLTSLATQFMDILRDEGYTVLLYSYNNFIRDHLSLSQLEGYNLWIANYLEAPTVAAHKVWQHTASGSVSGISGNVDINVAYEDLSTSSKKKQSSEPTSEETRDQDSTLSSAPQDEGLLEPETTLQGDYLAAEPISVSKAVSDTIKQTLNERYDVGLPIETLDMAAMNWAISWGIQSEINRQWGINLPVDGTVSDEQVYELSTVSFTSSTKGNITYLLQAKLFYMGYYQGEMTAQYDDATASAVRAFQLANNLGERSSLDYDTLRLLLR